MNLLMSNTFFTISLNKQKIKSRYINAIEITWSENKWIAEVIM